MGKKIRRKLPVIYSQGGNHLRPNSSWWERDGSGSSWSRKALSVEKRVQAEDVPVPDARSRWGVAVGKWRVSKSGEECGGAVMHCVYGRINCGRPLTLLPHNCIVPYCIVS